MDDELPEFDRFGHDEAWRLGTRLVERCRADDLPVVISIHLGQQGAGLSPDDFAPGEGAVPIRVRGTQVGVLSLSGLEPTGDHVLVVRALQDAAEADR